MQDPAVLLTVLQIEQAPTPMVRGKLRNEGRKVQAKAIRILLRDLGIKGVSVTAPNYSMAMSVDVRVPRLGCDHDSREEYLACTGCQMRYAAIERLESLILEAYPDLEDRSDSRSDHFDYCLSMGS